MACIENGLVGVAYPSLWDGKSNEYSVQEAKVISAVASTIKRVRALHGSPKHSKEHAEDPDEFARKYCMATFVSDRQERIVRSFIIPSGTDDSVVRELCWALYRLVRL